MRNEFFNFKDCDKNLLHQISAFEVAHFNWSWSQDAWESLSEAYYLCLCWEEELLRGVALWEKGPWDEVAHLHKIFVDAKFRSQKRGEKMMQISEDFLTKLGALSFYLEVQMKNIKAVKFYQRLGFEVICIKKNFYRDGSDAYAMQKLVI